MRSRRNLPGGDRRWLQKMGFTFCSPIRRRLPDGTWPSRAGHPRGRPCCALFFVGYGRGSGRAGDYEERSLSKHRSYLRKEVVDFLGRRSFPHPLCDSVRCDLSASRLCRSAQQHAGRGLVGLRAGCCLCRHPDHPLPVLLGSNSRPATRRSHCPGNPSRKSTTH